MFKLPEHYNTIETLPISRWFKINETNDLKYLLVNTGKINSVQYFKLKPVWEKVYKEFLEAFGVSEKMQKVLRLKREILIIKTKIHAEGRKDLAALLQIKETDLDLLTKETDKFKEKNNTGLLFAYVSKEMGFRIHQNDNTISTKEFYTNLEYIQQIKKAEAAARKRGKK